MQNPFLFSGCNVLSRSSSSCFPSHQPAAQPSAFYGGMLQSFGKKLVPWSSHHREPLIWCLTPVIYHGSSKGCQETRGRPARAWVDTLVWGASGLLCIGVRYGWAKRHLFTFDVLWSCLGRASGLTSLKSSAPSSLPSPSGPLKLLFSLKPLKQPVCQGF